MHKHTNQRIAVLVDAENLEITAQTHFQHRVDYQKLLEAINDREVIRALYYTKEDKVQMVDANGQNKVEPFLGFLTNVLGFEVKTSPKNADCFLTVDAIALACKVDVMVLVGGDSDYLPLVWYLKSMGVKTEIWMWKECTSRLLIDAADAYIPLKRNLLLQKNKGV